MARDFRDSVLEATAAVEALNAALDSLPAERTVHVRVDTSGMPDVLTAQWEPPADLPDMTTAAEAAVSAFDAQAEAVRAARAASAEYAAEQAAATAVTLDEARAQYMLAAARRMDANTAREQASASRDATAAASGARGWGILRFLRRDFPLFGGALTQMGLPAFLASATGLHVLIDGFAELAAVIVPATIAFGAFGIAAAPTLQDIYTHMKAVYTTSTALGQSIYPLTGGFDALANAVKPEVYTLFGEALLVLGHNTGTLTTLAVGAGHALDQLGARAAAALTSGGMGQFLASGPADLAKIGDLIGNIFGILGNVLKVMPGYAEMLLGAFDSVTHAIETLTATPVAQWVLGAGMAFHGAVLWLGLGATAAVAMGNALIGLAAKFGLAEEGALAFDAVQFGTGIMLIGSYLADATVALVTFSGAEAVATAATGAFDALLMTLGAVNPLVWVGAAVGGLIALTMWLGHAASATQGYDTAVNSALGNAPLGQLGTDLAQQHAATLGQVAGAQLALNSTQEYGTQINTHTGQQVQVVTYAYQHAQSVLAGYRGELATLSGYQKNYNTLLKAAGGNLTFLNTAGITSNDIIGASKSQMAQYVIEVQSAADAQKALALGTGQAKAANNAQTNAFMTQTLPAMQKVTQAEDAVMNVILAAPQAFISFQQSLGTMATDAAKTGASLGGLNANSLTLASDFYGTAVPALQKMVDSLQQQHISTSGLTKVIATGTGELSGFTKGNMEARSVLVSLINNALGPGTVSMRTLNSWVKHNSTSLQGMNSIIAQSTIQAGTLAGVLQSDLNAQFHQALLQTSGASAELHKYTWMLTHNKATTATGQAVRAQLIQDLRNAGLSAQQATVYVDGLATSLHKLHSKTITITTYSKMINVPGTTTPGPWSTGYTLPKGHAAGWKVPGHGHGDTVPAMLTPGEAVVPKHLVPAVAPFLAAHHVPGFAAGGVAGSAIPGPGPRPWHHRTWGMGDVAALWAREMWARDLAAHGAHSPIALAMMQQIFAGTHPGRGFLPRTALAGLLGADERHRLGLYHTRDLAYWHAVSQHAAALRTLHADTLLAKRREAADLAKGNMSAWIAEHLWLYRMQKHEHGLASHWASQRKRLLHLLGYGGPPVEAHWTPGPPLRAQPAVHVHLHGDLADEPLWERMQVRTLDYNYWNSGQPAGIWQPGG